MKWYVNAYSDATFTIQKERISEVELHQYIDGLIDKHIIEADAKKISVWMKL